MEFSTLSKELTTIISKTEKKELGIYFTPPSLISKILTLIEPFLTTSHTLLEPACGSCEFISIIHNKYPHLQITGIEYNETIYQAIQKFNNNKINILKSDFLKYETNEKYDVIIGNPPYFVIKKTHVDKIYYPYFDGRPNIFILFIIKSLQLLNDNGIFSFVLPKNFLNCLYYNNTRKYINDNFQILHIIDCNDKFIDTEQDTIILIIQKKIKREKSLFVLKIEDYVIFTNPENNTKLVKLLLNSKSLAQLGFKVYVGSCVWNQNKDILTDDETKTRLIYSSDIDKNNRLIFKKYKNITKKNFIKKNGITKQMIVLNRGYGTGEYKFNYCILNLNSQFLIENHLICIEYQNTLPQHELIILYEKIIHSFNDERTQEFIKIYFGNNAINTTELNYVLPIYI